jgi:phage-related protein
VISDEGGYDLVQTQMEINANGVDLRTIYGWLRGEGWLISSDEPDYKRYAYLNGQIEDDRFRTDATYDTLKVPVMAEAFLREVNEAAITLTDAGTFAGKGHEPAQPLLRITGSGDVNLLVNGVSVLIDGLDGTIVLDCEAGVAYKEITDGIEWAGNMVTLVDGWPELQPAGNTNLVNWSGSITQVVIQPQWRYL